MAVKADKRKSTTTTAATTDKVPAKRGRKPKVSTVAESTPVNEVKEPVKTETVAPAEINTVTVKVEDKKPAPIDEVKIDTQEVLKNLEKVSTEIPSNNGIEEVVKNIGEVLQPIEDFKARMEEIKKQTNELTKKIADEPEKAVDYVKEQIDKANILKGDIQKELNKIKETAPKKKYSFTEFWNGVRYDY